MPTVELGGRSLIQSTGNPSAVTWLDGPRVRPIPWVKVRCSLMKERVGSAAVFSSRAERSTCLRSPSMRYRSSSTATKS
jgi:hypothetical protein